MKVEVCHEAKLTARTWAVTKMQLAKATACVHYQEAAYEDAQSNTVASNARCFMLFKAEL